MAFLQERGLMLSEEKTHVTHINDGFDFLGFNARKYKGKLLIKLNRANPTYYHSYETCVTSLENTQQSQ